MNKIATINNLILISNSFDKKGLYQEADCLDKIILSYAIDEGLISEAGAKELLGQIGSVIGGGLDLAYQGTKKITKFTWNNAIKPAAKEIAKTVKVRPGGSLLIALLANAMGGLGVTPFSLTYDHYHLSNFIKENTEEFVDRVLSRAVDEYKYDYYTVQKGDNLYKIVKSLYPNQTDDFYEFAVKTIIEENKIDNPNSIQIGQKIMYAKNLPEVLAQSAEKVVKEEVVTAEVDTEAATEADEEVSFLDWAEQEEGKKSKKYRDGNGFLTIGIGHRLTSKEIRSGTIDINGTPVNFNAGLTEAQIKELYEQDRDSHNTHAKRVYENLYDKSRGDTSWEDLETYEKEAFQDFTFNVGPGGAKKMLQKVIRVEKKLTGPGISCGYQRFLADKGIWARRTSQTMWSRGAKFTKSDLKEALGGLDNSALGKRALFCLSADKDIKTTEGYKELVEELKADPQKNCKRWGS